MTHAQRTWQQQWTRRGVAWTRQPFKLAAAIQGYSYSAMAVRLRDGHHPLASTQRRRQRRPGVMQFESNRSVSGSTSPFCSAFLCVSSASRADLREARTPAAATPAKTSTPDSCRSSLPTSAEARPLPYLNLRDRCWFIFARGATPSTAMKNSFFGWIRLNRYCKGSRRATWGKSWGS